MNDKPFSKWISMSDNALSGQIGGFVKHHRINQNKTQESLAKEAVMSRLMTLIGS